MSNSQFYVQLVANIYILRKNEGYWGNLIKELEKQQQALKSTAQDEKQYSEVDNAYTKIITKIKEDL